MLKKVSYLILGFILMFSFYDNVFGDVCPNYSCPTGNGIDNGDTPVILYENKVTNTIQPSGTCGSSSIAEDNTPLETKTIYIDKDDGNQYNPCKYKCYLKNRIMIVIDPSKSMSNKFEKVQDMIREIANKAGSDDQIKICYFEGAAKCLNNNKWIAANKVEKVIKDMTIGRKNTDFVAAFETASKILNDIDDYVPKVFFLTDGYPTEIDSGDNSDDRALGYMSSARYAYRSVKALYSLYNSLKTANYKNPYAKANAEIITVGIGLDPNEPFARYILQPNSTNYGKLGTDGRNNNEARKLKSLLDGNSKQIEIVANVCSYPEKGGVVSGIADIRPMDGTGGTSYQCLNEGTRTEYVTERHRFCTNNNGVEVDIEKKIAKGKWTEGDISKKCKSSVSHKNVSVAKEVKYCIKYKQRHRIIFSSLPFNKSGYKSTIRQNGICFFGVDNSNNIELKMKKPNGQVVTLTEGEGKDYFIRSIGNKYGGKYMYVLYGDVYLDNPNAEYRLVWVGDSQELDARMVTYDHTGIPKYNNSVVTRSYLGDTIDGGLSSVIDGYSSITETKDEDLFDKKTRYTKSINNSVTKTVSLTTGDYYIRENGIYKRVSLSVPVLIKENMSFSAGDNLKAGITVDAGRGFSIGANATVKSTILWYYRYFANVSGSGNNITPSNPIVYVSGKKYTMNDIYINTSGDRLSNLDSLVWDKIKSGYISDISSNIASSYKTVDSNDKDDTNFTMPLSVERENGCNGTVSNSNSNGSNKSCVVTYKISQPKAYFDNVSGNYFYGYNDLYENSDIYTSEDDFSGEVNEDIINPYKYYIPSKYPKGSVPFRIVASSFSSIGLSNFSVDTSCTVNVGEDWNEVKPSYRTIDVNEPFPKASGQYNLIPLNWRDWYCNSGTGNNCNVNSTNKQRLADSYTNLNYEIKLDESKLTNIKSNTKNNGGYTILGDGNTTGMEYTGVSNFVTSYFTKYTTSDNFCKLGRFDESCDKW